MKIGILGAGNVGCGIAKLAVEAGHEVMLANARGPDTLIGTVAAIGCLAGTAEEAAAFGDAVVVAVPFTTFRSIPSTPLAGKVVIDTGNYYPERDGPMPELDERMTTTSEMVASHLPTSRIVKAFNAILATDLDRSDRPGLAAGRRALPLAGEDADAKGIVAALYDQFGFDAFDAGGLADAGASNAANRPTACR